MVLQMQYSVQHIAASERAGLGLRGRMRREAGRATFEGLCAFGHLEAER